MNNRLNHICLTLMLVVLMVLPMLLLAAISVILGLVPNGIIGFIQGILSF